CGERPVRRSRQAHPPVPVPPGAARGVVGVLLAVAVLRTPRGVDPLPRRGAAEQGGAGGPVTGELPRPGRAAWSPGCRAPARSRGTRARDRAADLMRGRPMRAPVAVSGPRPGGARRAPYRVRDTKRSRSQIRLGRADTLGP